MVPPGREPWSLVQRSAAVGRNGAKLLGVGFGASMFGVTITNVLLEVGVPSAGCALVILLKASALAVVPALHVTRMLGPSTDPGPTSVTSINAEHHLVCSSGCENNCAT